LSGHRYYCGVGRHGDDQSHDVRTRKTFGLQRIAADLSVMIDALETEQEKNKGTHKDRMHTD
jgi:hypothetical protein